MKNLIGLICLLFVTHNAFGAGLAEISGWKVTDREMQLLNRIDDSCQWGYDQDDNMDWFIISYKKEPCVYPSGIELSNELVALKAEATQIETERLELGAARINLKARYNAIKGGDLGRMGKIARKAGMSYPGSNYDAWIIDELKALSFSTISQLTAKIELIESKVSVIDTDENDKKVAKKAIKDMIKDKKGNTKARLDALIELLGI